MTITPTRTARAPRTSRRKGRPDPGWSPASRIPHQAEIQLEVAIQDEHNQLHWTVIDGCNALVGIADQATVDFLPYSFVAGRMVNKAADEIDQKSVARYRLSAAVADENRRVYTTYTTWAPNLSP